MTLREANLLALEVANLTNGMVSGIYEGISMSTVIIDICSISPKILEYLEHHVDEDEMNILCNLGIYPSNNSNF